MSDDNPEGVRWRRVHARPKDPLVAESATMGPG